MEQEVYYVNDFCKRYAISRSEFYREIKANRLRIMKRGCRTYVTRHDAEAWLESHRTTHATIEDYRHSQQA